ncbi:MAG: carboxypeptidase-like regulatory domain-containing protein [Kofleriaceae bacterium]
MAVLVCLVGCGPAAKPTPLITSAAPPTTSDAPAKEIATEFRVEVARRFGDRSIEGTIRDAATKEALPGVTIVAASQALVGTQVVISDDNGHFSFPKLPAGTYTVTAYYNDLTSTKTFEVADGTLVKLSLDWDLKSGPAEVITIDAKPIEYPNAMAALQVGAVYAAIEHGQKEIAKKPSSKLHGMLAIARYGAAVDTFNGTAFRRTDNDGPIATQARQAMVQFLADLDLVQEHLAAAAKDAQFSLELCVACMATDEAQVRLLFPHVFDIERDRAGKELPEDDPRRRPTYRFDHGDLAWARAMVSFHQAVANITLAYDWEWLEKTFADDGPKRGTKVTIKLIEAAHIAKARDQVLAGLAFSDESRVAYLAESDDDREWVPNPKQNSYASPLVVDAKLYKSWETIVGDVRALVNGEAGISLPALATVFGMRRGAPTGFLDIGAMLKTPKDIIWEVDALDRIESETKPAARSKRATELLRGLLGDGYKTKMKPSKLTDRLLQLRKDYDRNASDAFEDKLKYLLWIN